MDNLLLNSISLLSGDTWAKRELRKISADSDASRSDHGSVFWREGRSDQLGGIHVALMAPGQVILVIVLDDGVHQRSKGLVRFGTSGVDADS